MLAAIVTIGDEILIGHTVDTNSSFIAEQLNLSGIDVHEILTVSDDLEHIFRGIEHAASIADIIIITGGLGPTRDDKTREALASFFKVEMKLFPEIYEKLGKYFKNRAPGWAEKLKFMAELPANATVLSNERGTAAGMWFEENGKIYVSLPGVPHEMQELLQKEVLQRLKQKLKLPSIIHKHVLTASVPESYLMEKLTHFEDELPQHIKLAYLPSLGHVRLRLTASGDNWKQVEDELLGQVQKIQQIIPKCIYGYDDERLEGVIGDILKKRKATVAVAESCTGGFLAHTFTSIPSSSDYFVGGVVSYANEIKQQVLGVKKETLEKHGAVSEETVREMVPGITKACNSDYGIATSGIAGPTGGTPEKPVGTVWIAVGSNDEIEARKIFFPGNRLDIIKVTTVVAIDMLRKFLGKG